MPLPNATLWTRRKLLGGLLAGGCSVLAGCNWDGHINFLGYTSRPNYSEDIKTIYVPIFRNKAFQWTGVRGIEMELTRAVIREIEAKTPMKVISDPAKADTELLGTVLTINKNLLNRNQQNEVREGEVSVAVELVWRDLRSGKVLSNPRRPLGVIAPAEATPFDPDNPVLVPPAEAPIPVLVVFGGRYLPEVGETTLSAQQRVCNRLSLQIIYMMEKDWELPRKQCP